MKLKNTRLAASLIIALSLPSIASAAVVIVPDLQAGGTFTIDAGDSATNATNIAGDAATTGTLTVNGSWIVAGEIQLGGIAAESGQDATLNIGTTGVVSATAFWVAGGWVSGVPGNAAGTATINIAQGGQLTIAPGSFGIRAVNTLAPFDFTGDGSTVNGGNNALGVYTLLWNQGVLLKDGTQTGTFAQNFSFTQDGGPGAGTLTAIPEPSAALLGGLGLLALLRRRRN